jgi:hypothetical protein
MNDAKKIKVTLKTKTQMRIEENANVGDIVDITTLENTLDTSVINDI